MLRQFCTYTQGVALWLDPRQALCDKGNLFLW